MTTPVRDRVAAALRLALERAAAENGWPGTEAVALDVEVPANPAHGDYATSVALRLAKPLRRSPRDIASAIAKHVAIGAPIASVEIAGGGFVNLRLDDAWLRDQVLAITEDGEAYGRSQRLAGKRIQVEFISANPTGPLTVGNARGGPLGDVLAAVLSFAGAEVEREYYVEDATAQVKRFGISLAVRYRQLFGEEVELPQDGYQGDYVKDIAAQIKERHGARFREMPLEEQGRAFVPMAMDWMVTDAQRVAAKLGIHYDSWFRQSEFIASGYVRDTIAELRKRGVIVDRDGVIFFETPEAIALRREGEEGWVLVDAEGEAKYLATDIAYHRLCLEQRGFDLKLDVWGANTQYHVAQMKLVLPILGIDASRFEVLLYQYVRFLKEGVLTRMGRRTGQFLLLEDVIDAVGKDVTRFFLLQRSADSQLDFDFELAVQQSNDNPVYYVQYAHARIASIFRTAAERGLAADGDVQLLVAPGERELIRLCLRLPELLDEIVAHRGVHLLTVYALELAGAFHGFYRDHRVVSDDAALSRARLRLVQAVQVTLRQTLRLLGVAAPDTM